jgi:alginate O-acetyltransferase complex protein AlgI
MLFNSYIFILVFLPITWLTFFFVARYKKVDVSVGVLVVASLIFYSYWNPKFVLLILFSIGFNYAVGAWLQKARGLQAKVYLVLGIAADLALIGYFKYANFFLENVSHLTGRAFEAKDIFLPLGISFFTFQQIAYLVDCYKGLTKESRFVHYALFVSFFPQLIAGPIVHHADIIPQFRERSTYRINYRNVAIGLCFFSLGLFKKTVIADSFSAWVADGFDSGAKLTFLESWGATLSYAFQIYFDFSGYSDMAIGLGYFFNIRLPINFNSPYKATSIIDFWRRWHITLSTFLKDYLYIPLGGNRKGPVRRFGNVLVVMLLGGLWHGASWTFVFWGFLHGVFMCINHVFRKVFQRINYTLPKAAAWGLTFGSVSFAWVFFRAESFGRALDICKGMLGLNGVVIRSEHLPASIANVLHKLNIQTAWAGDWHLDPPEQRNMLILAFVICLLFPNVREWADRTVKVRPKLFDAVLVGCAFLTAFIFTGRVAEFLYFQF